MNAKDSPAPDPGSRLSGVQAALANAGLGLLVIGPTANMRYALGHRALPSDRLAVLLVTTAGAVMVMPGFEIDEFVEQSGFTHALPWHDRDGPEGALAAAFTELGIEAGVPAAVDENLPFHVFAALRPWIRPEPELAAVVLEPLRRVKSTEEQGRIGRTGELVSAAIDLAVEEARPGVTELELKRRLEAFLWDGGAESVDYVLVQVGANSAAAHHLAGHTPLRMGEPVLVDIAVCRDGYFADITQQVFLGDPPREYIDVYDAVSAAQAAGVAAVRAGATVDAVARAATSEIVERGYGDWNGPRTGHGLGLEVHEPPSVIEGNPLPLAPGMVITVEPGVYIPGLYGIRIEDTLVVTADGCRSVTRGARPLQRKAV